MTQAQVGASVPRENPGKEKLQGMQTLFIQTPGSRSTSSLARTLVACHPHS